MRRRVMERHPESPDLVGIVGNPDLIGKVRFARDLRRKGSRALSFHLLLGAEPLREHFAIIEKLDDRI
jgi:hypothetical protein